MTTSDDSYFFIIMKPGIFINDYHGNILPYLNKDSITAHLRPFYKIKSEYLSKYTDSISIGIYTREEFENTKEYKDDLEEFENRKKYESNNSEKENLISIQNFDDFLKTQKKIEKKSKFKDFKQFCKRIFLFIVM